jgi:putative glycosyltransferase
MKEYLSVVTSMYNNELEAQNFINKIVNVINFMHFDLYEIIIVDDFSTDNTLEILKKNCLQNINIKVIRLNKNCGQSFSLITGFVEAKGDLIFTLDSDLEENPDELIKFYDLLKSKQLDDVYGQATKRKGGLFEKISGYLFYKIANFFNNSEKQSEYFITSMRLFSKKVNENFKYIKDREIFFTSFFEELNFKSEGIIIEKKSSSRSTYNFNNKIKIFFDYFMLHGNNKIINSTFFASITMFLLLIVICSFFLINYLLNDVPAGFTSLILSIWFLNSFLIILNIAIIKYILKLYRIINTDNHTHIQKKINFD